MELVAEGSLVLLSCWRRNKLRLVDRNHFEFRGDKAMVLSGDEIKCRLGSDIKITPFEDDCLNPNSYNLSLHNELLVYEEVVLDAKQPNRFRRLTIPEEGMILTPGQIFLGRTAEYTETHNLVPMIEGRSSVARLGLFVHCASGFGDVGFCGYWTIEMFAVQPVRIYPGLRICQIFFHEITGKIREYCSEKYQRNHDVQPSMLYKEFGYVREYEQLELNFGSLAASCTEASEPHSTDFETTYVSV